MCVYPYGSWQVSLECIRADYDHAAKLSMAIDYIVHVHVCVFHLHMHTICHCIHVYMYVHVVGNEIACGDALLDLMYVYMNICTCTLYMYIAH